MNPTNLQRAIASFIFLLLSLLWISCSGTRATTYPDFSGQKENIRRLVLVVDIFAAQYGIGSAQTIVQSTNQDIGNFLVDTAHTLLSRRGYHVTRKFPALVGFSARVQRVEVVRTIDGRDTTLLLAPPLFVPLEAGRDSLFGRAMRAFEIAHSPQDTRQPVGSDSNRSHTPLDVLLYVYAYGDEVSTARGLAGSIIGGLTGMSGGKEDWHSMALELVDIATGRTLYRDVTGKGNRAPSKESFLRHLDALIGRLPMRGTSGSR